MKQLNFRYFKTNRKQLFVRAIFFFRKKQKTAPTRINNKNHFFQT